MSAQSPEAPEEQRPHPSASLTKARGLQTQLTDLIADLEAIDRMAYQQRRSAETGDRSDRVDASTNLLLKKIIDAGDASSRLTGDTHALARELSFLHGRVMQVIEYHTHEEAREAGR